MSDSNQKISPIGSVKTITPPPETPNEVFKRLAKLSIANYELVRDVEAKKLGAKYRVTTLDKGVESARKAAGIQDPLNSADDECDVVEMVKAADVVLFHDENDVPYAEVPNENHTEICQVESMQFRKWLASFYWDKVNSIVPRQELKDAIDTLAGLAVHAGNEHQVYLRVAFVDGIYYIDLCDDKRRVVAIDASGWRVLEKSPVHFRRTSTMKSLPLPTTGGDYTKLWNYLNIEPKDRQIVLALIIESYRADTQYVVGEIIGQQGSGKSSTQEIIKQLYDPNTLDLRAMPSKIDDIWVGTKNSHCLSFENVSNLSPKVQDAFCTIATGGGSIKRTLYSDFDETVLKACNPILINGIAPVVTASDLSDRAVRISLPKLNSSKRIESTKINTDFKNDRQSIFSGILDVFAGALSEIDNITLTEKPRMMSYAILGEAISKHLGLGWTFTADYLLMRKSLLIQAAQNSSGAMAISKMMNATKQTFYGTYKELLTQLNQSYTPKFKSDDWPKNPRALSGVIARYIPGLEAMGIKITSGVHTSKGNMVKIELE